MSEKIRGRESIVPQKWASELVSRSSSPGYELLAGQLDYSLGSLNALDAFLGHHHYDIGKGSGFVGRKIGRKKLSEDTFVETVRLAGGYIGEVIRRVTGNKWNWFSYETWCEDAPKSPAIWGEKSLETEFIIGDFHGAAWTPLNKAFKRIIDGPADDVHSFAAVVIDQSDEILSKKRSD